MKKLNLLLLVWGFFLAPQIISSEILSHHHQEESQSTMVYICTGSQSKRYHSSDRCRGLTRCSKSIKKVTLQEAQKQGRTPCQICYSVQ